MNKIVENQLPTNLYSAQAVRQLDSIAINEFGISGYELMKRAGKASFNYLQNTWPLAKHIVVCCGAGNNAGDGYVIARLAMQAGLDVSVISLVEPEKLQGDAKKAWQDWHSMGHQLAQCAAELFQQADVIVDALLGTGLAREVEGRWADLIDIINCADKAVLAVDIPSGLCADTGRVAGAAVCATATMTFIGIKKGMLTNRGVDYCGEISFDDLGISQQIYERQPAQAKRMAWSELCQFIKPRQASSHKHQHGHLLVLGGDRGMPGAIRLAAEAALRCGAGLVTVVSHVDHASVVLAGCPEIMFRPAEDGHVPVDLLSSASAVVVGPGLTESPWSRNILDAALQSAVPKVVDAGALRLIAKESDAPAFAPRTDWVLTPHAGEAAALLGEAPQSIQDSRFASAELLQLKFGGHTVLKGAGSLLQSGEEPVQLCAYGNPGMAVAGMGDVLSGVLGALLAQGYDMALACQLGVCIHSLAGDMAAEQGQTGLLASDLFPEIRKLMNKLEKDQERSGWRSESGAQSYG
ncbi:MAG TPA: NAD(P)H-hydrate dehydratase [Gammaproteobacteria bacterium]|nr:NAD(P)H-hydrate dehydratase [Gammaproteobacteria bacterium]